MTPKSTVFEDTLKTYLERVRDCDRIPLLDLLQIELKADRLAIPLFGRPFFIGADAVADADGNSPSHSISVLLCNYIIQCPSYVPDPGPLVTYKDFRDAAPFVGGFANLAQKPVADYFSGQLEDLKRCCQQLGARPFQTEAACQFAVRLPALPRVPIYLMFNDADEDFEADCTLLFRRSAATYLDMECLAILGDLLATWLQKINRGHRGLTSQTINGATI